MHNIKFDFFNVLKAIKGYLIKTNIDFKAKSVSHKFYKHYCFRGGLDNKYKPFILDLRKGFEIVLNSEMDLSRHYVITKVEIIIEGNTL